ncbi:MAG: hypothetical protein AUK44_03565 [Porphyromonadaceae bacterium CG2_30_38_12]|nr:MAG: hypothetical protein AUK44_03565 [Porphyromonadaceae bacterium CG2_30_38_12]
MEQNKPANPFSEEEESSFDIMEWVNIFLHFWYLFVIFVIISLGMAYLKNRTWIPSYKSAGTMLIEEYKITNNTQAMMQGFGVDAGYKNTRNQIIMLSSYDLIGRVVDSLPQMRVDYISKGNFKTRNLYNASPIQINPDYIAPEAFNLTFKLDLNANGTFTITVDENKQYENFKLNGNIGEPISNNLFFITINNTNSYYAERELYFQFRSRESLISDFASRLTFNFVQEGSSVLEIAMNSETPERDIDYINKHVTMSLLQNLERKNDAANKTINFIDEQLQNVSKSLTVSQGEMTDFRQRNQIINVDTHAGELLGKSNSYESQFSTLKLKETYLDYLTKYLRTNMEDGSIIAPSSLGLNEPMLMGLVSQINDLNLKRSELSEKNMYYAKYTRDIDHIKVAINEVTKNMRASLEIEKNDLKEKNDKVNKEIEQLPSKEIEMTSIARKYKMDDNYYTFFLQKRAESEILKSSNTPDNNILDRARIIAVTNDGTQSKTTLTFLIIGLLIPAAFVALREFSNGTIRSNKDIEKNSKFTMIGSVRHTNSNDPLITINNPRSAFTEMFRVIRTRIEFIVQRKKNIMVAVTSSESGDGKTYFSINMAGVYSMASKKVLLVDLDIRKPSIHERFNINPSQGITNFLVGQATLDEVIIHIPELEYDFLPGGTVPPNAGELIRSEKLVEMFQELRNRYEFIVVDTSPIGIVADAYAIAHLSDINIFVARSGKTSKSHFAKISKQLKSDNVEAYCILNDVMSEESRYSRYYSRRYGYGYGYGYGSGYGYGYGYGNTRKKKEASEKYFQYYQDDREI